MRAAILCRTVVSLVGGLAVFGGPAFGEPGSGPSDLAGTARGIAEQTARDEALIAELGGMGAVDQHLRLRFLELRRQARTDAERAALNEVFRTAYKPFDERHARRLRALLDGRPWFRVSEVGPRAEQAASLIVDHSNDLAFQKEVLAKMEPLVGVETPPGYANLYDRVAVQEGRPQRYATQATACDGGKHAMPHDLEDPGHLDARRRAVGLVPMAEYLANLDQLYGPCRFN